MKVLVISAALPPVQAGEVGHTLSLCHHLAERGLDVHLLTTRNAAPPADCRATTYPIMKDWSWSDLVRLTGFLRRCDPAVILLVYTGWIYNQHPMITFTAAISRKVLPRARFVTQFEYLDPTHPEQTSLVARALRRGLMLAVGPKQVDYNYGTLLRDSHRIIVLCEEHRTFLAARLPEVTRKSVLIPAPPPVHVEPDENGAARRLGRQLLGAEPNDFLIVHNGYIHPDKGIDTLLRAFQLVSGRHDRARLAIVGGAAESEHYWARRLVELAEQLGISSRVSWTGYVESRESSPYLRGADAAVFPFNDGIMLNRSSVAAAAAHGLPIVSTRGKTLAPLFSDGQNVLLCTPGDAESLAAALDSVIQNQELRERLANGARQLTSEAFSWSKAIDRVMAAALNDDVEAD